MTESGDGRRLAALLEAAAPEPPTTVELADVARRVQRRRRRAWLAPLAAALVVIAVAAGVVGVTHDRGHTHRREPTPATSSPFVTTTLNGLTLTHPRAWRFVAPDRRAISTVGEQLGWFTNQQTFAQCHFDRRGDGGCHAPVTSLAAGGVLVSVFAAQFPAEVRGSAALDPTRTIDGFPTVVVRDQSETDCPAGMTYAVEAEIQEAVLGNDSKSIEVSGCFAAPGDVAHNAQFSRLMNSIRIPGKPPKPDAEIGIRWATPLDPPTLTGLQAGTITLELPNHARIIGDVRAKSRLLVYAPPGIYRVTATTAPGVPCGTKTIHLGPAQPHRLSVVCPLP